MRKSEEKIAKKSFEIKVSPLKLNCIKSECLSSSSMEVSSVHLLMPREDLKAPWPMGRFKNFVFILKVGKKLDSLFFFHPIKIFTIS